MTTSAKRTFLDFDAAPERPTGSRLSRPHISTTLTFFAMAHYSCRVTVSEGRVMQRCGWMSRKSGDFSAFAANPITIQSSPFAAQHRAAASKSNKEQLPLAALSAAPHLVSAFVAWVSGDKGGPNEQLPRCCLLQSRQASRDMSEEGSAHTSKRGLQQQSVEALRGSVVPSATHEEAVKMVVGCSADGSSASSATLTQGCASSKPLLQPH